MNVKEKGYLGEEIACEYLKSIGYTVIERNYTIKGGEVDIIALDGNVLVFVEVKSRTGREEAAAAAIDEKKISRLVASAEKYVLDKSETATEMKLRFDCIEVYFNKDVFSEKPDINHYKDIDAYQ